MPLIGASLWTINRVSAEASTDLLFPRYCSLDGCKADYAGNALNEWLRQYVPRGCVVHSFRHSIRERLRAVNCPNDLIEQIGVWRIVGIGNTCGRGYYLVLRYDWLKKVKL